MCIVLGKRKPTTMDNLQLRIGYLPIPPNPNLIMANIASLSRLKDQPKVLSRASFVAKKISIYMTTFAQSIFPKGIYSIHSRCSTLLACHQIWSKIMSFCSIQKIQRVIPHRRCQISRHFKFLWIPCLWLEGRKGRVSFLLTQTLLNSNVINCRQFHSILTWMQSQLLCIVDL